MSHKNDSFAILQRCKNGIINLNIFEGILNVMLNIELQYSTLLKIKAFNALLIPGVNIVGCAQCAVLGFNHILIILLLQQLQVERLCHFKLCF